MTMTDAQGVQTPELDRRKTIMDSTEHPHDTLTRFVDWLSERGIELAEWDESDDPLRDSELRPVYAYSNREKLLADFFDLDLDKIETERRALLEAIGK